MSHLRSTQHKVSKDAENRNFDAGTALEHLRAEVIDIEALARAAEAAAETLPAPMTDRQRIVFGRIQSLATKASEQASASRTRRSPRSKRRWRHAGRRRIAEQSPGAIGRHLGHRSGRRSSSLSPIPTKIRWKEPRHGALGCERGARVSLVGLVAPVTGRLAISQGLFRTVVRAARFRGIMIGTLGDQQTTAATPQRSPD